MNLGLGVDTHIQTIAITVSSISLASQILWLSKKSSYKLKCNFLPVEFWEIHLTSLILSFLGITRVITLVEANLAKN